MTEGDEDAGEPSMPFALDPSGNLIEITNALPGAHYYRCIECKQHVHTRQGDVYTWGFAHNDRNAGPTESRNCPLRSREGVARAADEANVVNPGQAGQARLAVLLDWELDAATLVAVVPSLAQCQALPTISRTIRASLTASGHCLRETVRENHFQPSRWEAELAIDPDREIAIEITAAAPIPGITGTWHTTRLEPGDIFFGTSERAVRPIKNQRGTTGDIAYLTTESTSAERDALHLFDLGNLKLLALSAEMVPGVAAGQLAPLDSMLVLPARLPPSCTSPIRLRADEPALVALMLPEESSARTEPTLLQTLPHIGRIERADERLRILRFDAAENRSFARVGAGPTSLFLELDRTDDKPVATSEPSFGVRLRGKTAMFMGEVLTLPRDSERVRTELEVLAPAGLSLELSSRDPSNQPLTTPCTIANAAQRIAYAMDAGETRLRLCVQNLGSVHLHPAPKNRLDVAFLASKAQALPPGKKVRWAIVRHALGIDVGTPHRNVPSGAKKLLRRHRRRA